MSRIHTILLDLDCGKLVLGNGESVLPRAATRFASKFKEVSKKECWEYPGVQVDGYVQVRATKSGRFCQAHRLSWMIYNGKPVPAGLLVLHECDNRRCVNPHHLFLGTYKTNAEDREKKGRGNQPKGERNWGSVLTDDQVQEIRRLYVKGKKGNTKMLKRMFNVTQPTIYRVANYLGWKHV